MSRVMSGRAVGTHWFSSDHPSLAPSSGVSTWLSDHPGGAFDLSPKADPDQMWRPGRAFDFAVLPVLSNPGRTVGAVLQWICSLSRSVGADRTGADIWSAIKLVDFVRQKQGFLRQVLLCLVMCFHFGLAQFPQLLSSFGRFADEEESSDNALTCPAQSPHGVQAQISSLSFVNRKATSSRLLARVVVCFYFGLAHLFNFSQALVVATKRKAARKCVDLSSAVVIWSSGAHAPTPDEKWQPSCRFSILILSSRPKKLLGKTTSQKPLRPHELSDTDSPTTFFFPGRDRSQRSWRNVVDH